LRRPARRSALKTRAAILDRLLHHSTTISIKGVSYRLKDRKKAGLVTLPATR
jgi:DNA replication protein DnaC